MELALIPSRNNVHSKTPIGVVVNASHLLGDDSRIPGTGKNSGNDLELLGVVKESLRERDRLVLGRGTVRGSEADLSESVLEADGLGGTGIADVGLEIPARVLGDLGDDKTSGDVGYPVAAFRLVPPEIRKNVKIAYAKRSRSGSLLSVLASTMVSIWACLA